MCAPYQGMSRLGRTWFGRLEKGGTNHFTFHLQNGQCARLFAAADDTLESFRTVIRDPDGQPIGLATSSNGLLIANADGAFCVHATGDYRAEVRSDGGSGLVAAEIWTLPPP